MKRGFFLAGAIGAGVLPGGRTALVAQTTARPEARAQTAPVPHKGDAADDPAVWIQPRDPGFYVFVTDEKGRVEQQCGVSGCATRPRHPRRHGRSRRSWPERRDSSTSARSPGTGRLRCLRLAGKIYVVSRRKADWRMRADALLSEAARVAERAPSGRVVRAEPAAAPARFALRISALELVLQALSARPATPGELDQIRRLLVEMSAEKKGP